MAFNEGADVRKARRGLSAASSSGAVARGDHAAWAAAVHALLAPATRAATLVRAPPNAAAVQRSRAAEWRAAAGCTADRSTARPAGAAGSAAILLRASVQSRVRPRRPG